MTTIINILLLIELVFLFYVAIKSWQNVKTEKERITAFNDLIHRYERITDLTQELSSRCEEDAKLFDKIIDEASGMSKTIKKYVATLERYNKTIKSENHEEDNV